MIWCICVFVSLVLLLPACSSRSRQHVLTQSLDQNASGKEEKEHLLNTLQHKQAVAMCSVRQEEAKLFDVPIPLDVRPLERFEGSDAASSLDTFLAYATSNSIAELQSFYQTQMERFGWRQAHFFYGPELILIFEKPNRTCAISLRLDRRKNTQLIVTLSQG